MYEIGLLTQHNKMECIVCKSTENVRACGGCSTTKYCSEECQEQDWSSGNHAEMCSMKKNRGTIQKISGKPGEEEEETTSLIIAIRGGNLQLVRQLLKERNEILKFATDLLASNTVNLSENASGKTALSQAILAGNLDIIRELISADVDVNFIGIFHSPNAPLMIAIGRQNLNIIRMLLDAGANINRKHVSDETPLMRSVAGDGDLKVVQILVENGADINAENTSGQTALDIATVNKVIGDDIIQYLEANGAVRGSFSK